MNYHGAELDGIKYYTLTPACLRAESALTRHPLSRTAKEGKKCASVNIRHRYFSLFPEKRVANIVSSGGVADIFDISLSPRYNHRETPVIEFCRTTYSNHSNIEKTMETETATCEFCGKTFSAKMHYCPHCGGERRPEPVRKAPACPHCGIDLVTYEYRGNDLDMCPSCNGLWLDNREFRRLTSERDVFADESIPYDFRRQPLKEEVQYLKCPLCDSLMVRRNFKKISGVIIDICRYHGVWLEAGELEQIRCFVANGGLETYKDKEILANAEAIKSLDTRLSDAEFMQKLLHHWKFKRWIFSK